MSQHANTVDTTDPDFIVYLLDPEQEYNCYFVVGNPVWGNTERIGVVKKMLLAHSPVLRVELQDSKIAEKNDVKVTDLFPSTFKNLLRFVYGYDNTQQLSFDEADNLLYAAEKYMMPKLKNKLATKLLTLLNYSNICSLMNNPACYTVLQLESTISKILQLETHRVLTSPQFLGLSSRGLLTILEQEMTDVSEIELWRSAVKWAQKQVRERQKLFEIASNARTGRWAAVEGSVSIDGRSIPAQTLVQSLRTSFRQRRGGLLRRVDVQRGAEPYRKVLRKQAVMRSAITDGIPTGRRGLIGGGRALRSRPNGFFRCRNGGSLRRINTQRRTEAYRRGKSAKRQDLRKVLADHVRFIRFCSMSPDEILREVIPTKVLTYNELVLVGESHRTGQVQPTLTTICNLVEERKHPPIQSKLLSQSLCSPIDNICDSGIRSSMFQLKTNNVALDLCAVQLYSSNMAPHQCNCIVVIQRSTETPVVTGFEGHVSQDSNWTIPILVNERNVRLSPNSSYLIKFTFACSNSHYGLYHYNGPDELTGSHFSVAFQPHSNHGYVFQIRLIQYKTITPPRDLDILLEQNRLSEHGLTSIVDLR